MIEGGKVGGGVTEDESGRATLPGPGASICAQNVNTAGGSICAPHSGTFRDDLGFPFYCTSGKN